MKKKFERVVLLNDFYGALLTEKQTDALRLHYENDWSLAEIADSFGSSRQAVHDLIRRSNDALENYEQQLGFVDKYNSNRQLLQEALSLLQEKPLDDSKLERINDLLLRLQQSI